MAIQATRYKPESVVSFSTETGNIVLRMSAEGEVAGGVQGNTIDNSVLSISTNNDLSADAATFEITLAYNERWNRLLASNDLVWISMYRHPERKTADKATVMVGLIDDVRKNVSVQGNSVQRVTTVTGRSFAKALINFEVGVVDEVEMTESSLGWLLGRVNFTNMSSAQIVDQILEKLVYKYMDYNFTNGHTFKTITEKNLTSRSGETLVDDRSFINYQGSIWSFLREIVNEPFNQIYWECYGKPTLVVRETPFNPNTWKALPIYEITDEDVVLENIGRGDIETYSLFSVGLQAFFNSFDANKTLGVFPYWYEPYFKKFGLRRLQRFTAYAGYMNQSDAKDASERLKAYQKDLFNWNIHNPSFLNGFITVRGENHYKVGDRLLFKSVENGEDYEFFIESVSHDFINFGHWITRIGVTRGLPKAGAARFDTPWNKFSTYEGGALGAPAVPPIEAGTPTGSIPLLPSDAPAGAVASSVINYANTFIGKVTYGMGWGRNPSDIERNRFDCSSFVNYVLSQNGIHIADQSSVTTDVLARQGSAVYSISEIKLGDLIFFNTYKYNGHVGIYVGGGKFIGAQSSGVNVQDVKWWINEYGLGSIRRVFLA